MALLNAIDIITLVEMKFFQLIFDGINMFNSFLRLRPSLVTFGATPFVDLRIMFDFIREKKCRKILELGIGDGDSTKVFLSYLYFMGEGHLTSIDKDPCIQIRSLVKFFEELNKYWTFIQQDDIKVKWNQKIDLLFIDSSHEYKHTLKELNKFSPFAKYIFLHDYGEKHKTQGDMVKRAVTKFLKKNKKWKLEKVFTKGYGLVLLVR